MTTRTLQDLFVDRLKQLERFRKSLEGATPRRLILIEAPQGMGKSWLLRQFVYEAAQRGTSAVLLDFADGQAYDALMLMRRFRDDLGALAFNAFTQAINDATTPRLSIDGAAGTVNIGTSGTLSNVGIGDIAGGNILKDNYFVLQTDNPIVMQALEDRLTSVFMESLAALAQRTPLLFCFDSYERTSLEAERWLSNAADRWIMRQLLMRIRDGQLPNVTVVLAGVRLPEFDITWNQVLGRLTLEPFVATDVAEYLRENRGLTALSDTEIQTLFNATQGNPQLLALVGDNLEQATQRPNDDEW